jgi:hypothetical protein
MRGGIQQNHAFDKKGNCYLAGYFNKEADFGTFKLKASSPNRQCFVAKFDESGKPIWAKNLDGKGISTGISVTTMNNQPIVMGTFSGNIGLGRQQLHCEKNQDIFVLKLGENGETEWLSNARLNAEDTEMPLRYAITFNSHGSNLKTDLFTESPANPSEGIFVAGNGDILIAGAFNNTTGFSSRRISFADQGKMDYIELLKTETDELISNNTEKSISGLFAVIRLIKNTGITIPGESAKEALDKYNPGFKKEYKSIYNEISRINFLKNKDGIVNITTADGKTATFDKIRLSNNAKVKINTLADGNEQLDVLSGISVGKFVVWYNLNFVRLFKSNGDLMFDYDTDHTQTTINLGKDILDR